jgi:hypothetical protein
MTQPRQGTGTSEQDPKVAPEVEAFLQKIESYAQTLPQEEATALRRLIRAGLMADEKVAQEIANDDTGGYQYGYYYGNYYNYYGYYYPYYTYSYQNYYYYYPYWYPIKGYH